MALEITNNTKRALQNLSIEPNIVLKIDGVPFYFSSSSTSEYIRIGDPDLFIDGSWYIGGFRELTNNRQLIDSSSTTYTIRQQMNYDEGEGSSISTMTIGLVDKDEFVTRLITPGEFVDDILGRKCQVFIGFGTTSLNDDYIEVFKGFISDIDSLPGLIKFKINHPDNKKKINLFKEQTTKLTASIPSNSTLSCTVESTDGFLSAVSGVLDTYIRIDNEVMKYTVTGPTSFSLLRGQLGTTATLHDNGAEVTSVYALLGNPLDLALVLMLSGFGNDPCYEDVKIEQFVSNGLTVGYTPNSIFFSEVDISKVYNLQVGDFVSVTGATQAANNFANRTITAIESNLRGSTIVVDGTALVDELGTSAVASFKSQYDLLSEGMKMLPDEVDIVQHNFIRDFFHPATEYRLIIDEDIDSGKEFLDQQIYKPIACYSLPRKAKSSVGYSIGPIPGSLIKTLSVDNVTQPTKTGIKRTLNRSFFNEVVYKYDKSPLTDKYLKLYGEIAQDSKNRIFGGNRTYKVESRGLQSDLNADNIVQAEAQRIIDRYKFAAETVNASALLRDSVDIEIGDVVVLEGAELKISDITQGSRAFKPRLFEVRNKEINLKTGAVDFELLDTGQNIDTRFGLMTPVSKIATVVSQSVFIITHMDNYVGKFGLDEFRDWESQFDLSDGIRAKIRDAAYTVSESVLISNITGNTFTLAVPAVMTLTSGMVLEVDDYDLTTEKQKLLYAFYQDNPTFADGENQYSMI